METRKFLDASQVMQFKDTQILAPPRATDPGWAHGTMVDGDRQKIKCKYCNKIFSGGGISRLKQHLACERGNVVPCEEVPEDVKMQMQQHLGYKILKKLKRQKGMESVNNSGGFYFQGRQGGDTDDITARIQKTASMKGTSRKVQKKTPVKGTIRRRGKEIVEGVPKRTRRQKKQLIPTAAPLAVHTLQSFTSQVEQADIAVARFMYDAGIPFGAANSRSFQKMADAIAAAGPGYKMPSYHSLRGKLLNKSVQDIGQYCEELKKSWEVTGCSVLVDRWIDRTGRTVINFFVYCPKGTMFLKSIDASDIATSPNALLDIFDSVVQEVSPRNIVNFVTDSSPSYKAAGKLLMERYKTFFCSTCAVQCIDLILEEIAKVGTVKEVLAGAKRITQLIYNSAWVLNLMRKKTGGKDILQCANTRFASVFLTLQSIYCLKDQLHQIFTSAAWMQSTLSKQRAGLEVAETVVDPLFWSLCEQALKVAKPVLSVLHLLDSEERSSVGYIYDAMEKAKKSIIVEFDNKESDYLTYLDIIDHVWKEEFHSPLHAAAYYLNPSTFYNPSFSSAKASQKGLLDCIETLEPNLTAQVAITSHIPFYEEAVGDFGRPVALRGRESLAPATWWSLYAADYPDLQRLAVRILSQTCTITRSDRSRTMLERIHSKKRNRLEHKRLNGLFFVHYNLHLQERHAEAQSNSARGTFDPVCLEALDASMGDWMEDLGVTESEGSGWLDVTIHSEQTSAIHEVQNVDISNDSADDRTSDVSKDINENEDL